MGVRVGVRVRGRVEVGVGERVGVRVGAHMEASAPDSLVTSRFGQLGHIMIESIGSHCLGLRDNLVLVVRRTEKHGEAITDQLFLLQRFGAQVLRDPGSYDHDPHHII